MRRRRNHCCFQILSTSKCHSVNLQWSGITRHDVECYTDQWKWFQSFICLAVLMPVFLDRSVRAPYLWFVFCPNIPIHLGEGNSIMCPWIDMFWNGNQTELYSVFSPELQHCGQHISGLFNCTLLLFEVPTLDSVIVLLYSGTNQVRAFRYFCR